MYREKVEEEHVGKDQIGTGAKYVELFLGLSISADGRDRDVPLIFACDRDGADHSVPIWL